MKHFVGNATSWSLRSEQLTRKHALRRIQAAAEVYVASQYVALHDVCGLVQGMSQAGEWQPLTFLHYVSYDETQQDIMMQFATDHAMSRQIAKVFVVKQAWVMLLRQLGSGQSLHTHASEAVDAESLSGTKFPDLFVLEGVLPTSVRGCSSSNGETTQAVLQSCGGPPSSVEVFKTRIRLVECDECGSNGRAEQLVLSASASSWWHFSFACLAHKVHACAQKSWVLPGHAVALTGIINTCKSMAASGAGNKLRDTCAQQLRDKFSFRHHDVLDPEALLYRRRVIDTFSVRVEGNARGKAVLKLMHKFFNGDWRDTRAIIHTCSGCCASRGESLEKAAWLLRRFTTCFRPRMFSRDNWLEWQKPLVWFGHAFCMHAWLASGFVETFSRDLDSSLHIAQQPLEESAWLTEPVESGEHSVDMQETTETAQVQAERLKSLKSAVGFMGGGQSSREAVLLLQATLRPEQELMKWFLHGESWEREQQHSMIVSGQRQYRVSLLGAGDQLRSYFAETWNVFAEERLWESCVETESFRSQLFRMSMRPAAVCHQLIRCKARSYPSKLFDLIRPELNQEQVIDELLQTPKCMFDRFTAAFLQEYPDRATMRSGPAMAILHIVARKVQLTTFSVERLHSINLRRARARVETTRVPLQQLALGHVCHAASEPETGREEQSQSQTQCKRGRPQKVEKKRQNAGSGGAWRAFVAHNFSGQKLSGESMRQASRDYGALSEEDRRFYIKLGRAGM